MYSALLCSATFLCLHGIALCDDVPVQPSVVPVQPFVVPGNNSAPVHSDPVKPDVPEPAKSDPPALLKPVVVDEATNGSLPLDGADNATVANTSVDLVQVLGGVEVPETSARKLNVPGLLEITPDSVGNIIGASCKNDSHCTANHTFCEAGACRCATGYRASALKLNACVPLAKALGDGCETNKECDAAAPDSECIGDKCICPPSFVADQGTCWERKALGAACESTVQCMEIIGAACLQGVCACPSNPAHVPSPTSNKCLKAATGYQSECMEDIQCTVAMGDDARCNNLVCICKDSFHYNGSRCIVDRKLGSPCQTMEDCSVSLLTEPANRRACTANNCTCAPGFKVMKGEDNCVSKGAADQITISLTWMICVAVAKYFI